MARIKKLDLKEKTNEPVIKLLADRKITTKKGGVKIEPEVFNFKIISKNSLDQIDRYVFEKGYSIVGYQNLPKENDKENADVRKTMLMILKKYDKLIEENKQKLGLLPEEKKQEVDDE